MRFHSMAVSPTASRRDSVLSGMRPSGKLHLGNYFGALQSWVKMQDDFNCFFMVADWHALTSDYADTSDIESNVQEMMFDWLAAGLDPQRSIIFRQSWIKQHAELHLLLSMITPTSWLERNPTYKEQMQEVKNKDLSTYGFLGYPVLQTADILLYRAVRVPVGEDQLPHLELGREIARRFNYLYGNVFPEPQALLSKAPRVPGTDGRKMSKSYNNAVLISDSKEEVAVKVKQMYTDPKKIRLADKGNPDGCVVYATHRLYTPEWEEVGQRCRAGTLGCVACKGRLIETLSAGLEPLREKRAQWVSQPGKIRELLESGSAQAAKVAQQTMRDVYRAMKLDAARISA
jgi:tryptophanyl-tRNA synthetase